MNKREAKALVFRGLEVLCASGDNPWLDVGSDADQERMRDAFEEVMSEFRRRSQGAPNIEIGGVE